MGSMSRVLHIEDDAHFAELVRRFFRQRGDEYDYADTLKGALLKLSSTPFDLIVLDLKLPDAHEMSALEQIRAEFPKIPVLILSGDYDVDVIRKALSRGAQGYATKKPDLNSVMTAALETLWSSDSKIHQLTQELLRKQEKLNSLIVQLI